MPVICIEGVSFSVVIVTRNRPWSHMTRPCVTTTYAQKNENGNGICKHIMIVLLLSLIHFANFEENLTSIYTLSVYMTYD